MGISQLARPDAEPEGMTNLTRTLARSLSTLNYRARTRTGYFLYRPFGYYS